MKMKFLDLFRARRPRFVHQNSFSTENFYGHDWRNFQRRRRRQSIKEDRSFTAALNVLFKTSRAPWIKLRCYHVVALCHKRAKPALTESREMKMNLRFTSMELWKTVTSTRLPPPAVGQRWLSQGFSVIGSVESSNSFRNTLSSSQFGCYRHY